MAGDREARLAADGPDVGEGQRLGAEPLEAFLARTPRLAVAFSGGCDSAYLLAAARAAGCEVRAYRVDTAFQPAFERDDAARVAAALGVPLTTIPLDVLACDDVAANPPDRCYRCKRLIFDAIRAQVERDAAAGLWGDAGAAVPIADGTNGSDDPARRPGFRALAERGVVSPLRRAGLAKADVRAAARALAAREGADSDALLAAKPSFPCLAVFVGEGAPLTPASLAEAARARGLA
ncbi:7-cyano-7-deazaguanine synthase [Adlercreutzia faecimuris]|uniref:7-cyano-7-deazaguanine synthase n=1 Tax=Adlercreutzia faecimuris TaxID=2897341 RepID=A0ABS9WFR8_9ACTN|nr:7-cyano-7-deazaguanine synthase [Adlercreutzia sp. JBNU-10]